MQKKLKGMKIAGLLGKNPINLQENSFQTTRRLAIGLASVALIGNSSTVVSLAEDNWWARDIPFSMPSGENKLAKEETGTRPFLKTGIYMANVGLQGGMGRRPLSDLADRLFDNFENLEDASRKNLSDTVSSHRDMEVLVQKVMEQNPFVLKSRFTYYPDGL
ncbi:hypothetical protein SADUNF_Sadunf11G0096400 [Salix dunnii]|uniref:Uncharacterized protein n=1 Tax=Salix dunnii TaxID=1413687 RepID=A0A835MX96_9ROSI|nr:hypothetical protein SADUNF_Sadunf11G0096400 [Salix dunnii]